MQVEEVRTELASLRSSLELKKSQMGSATLDKDVSAISNIRAEISVLRSKIEESEAALVVAEDRDQRAAEERDRRASLRAEAAQKKLILDRQEAAKDVDAALEALSRAFEVYRGYPQPSTAKASQAGFKMRSALAHACPKLADLLGMPRVSASHRQRLAVMEGAE